MRIIFFDLTAAVLGRIVEVHLVKSIKMEKTRKVLLQKTLTPSFLAVISAMSWLAESYGTCMRIPLYITAFLLERISPWSTYGAEILMHLLTYGFIYRNLDRPML